MASSDHSQGHRRNNTTQSIPLEDLSRAEERPGSSIGASSHRRTLSERGRRLLSRNGTRSAGGILRSSYTPLEGSPRALGSTQPTLRTIDAEQDVLEAGREQMWDGEIEGDMSLLTERYKLSEAMVGLSGYDAPMSSSALPQRHHETFLGRSDSVDSFPDLYDDEARDDAQRGGSISNDDSTPLRNPRYLQPVGITGSSIPSGQRHDRSRTLSVRRVSWAPSLASSARLGDELAAAEEGRRSTARNRGSSDSRLSSLSPSVIESPLQRAGTIVREMSQRIVNLSNDPEVAQNTPSKRSSSGSIHSDDPVEEVEVTDHSLDGARSQVDVASTDQAPQPPSHQEWVRHTNPFKGHSLGIFPPDSPVRTWLCDFLVHPATEPAILFLIIIQTVLLAVDAAPNVFDDPNPRLLNGSWINLALLALFVIYTIEIVIRMIVSGLVINPVQYSTINRGIGLKKALYAWYKELFALNTEHSHLTTYDPEAYRESSDIGALAAAPSPAVVHGDDRHSKRVRLAHRAFLRHSFNRLDFLAVVSFWISFTLADVNLRTNSHIHSFRMLASLRIMRLLGLTSGTSVILRSLKKAAPLLLNVALLIGFFWLLFAIVGVQGFKSSLRRTCVWVDPDHVQGNYTLNATGLFQFCGGSVNASGDVLPWYYPDGSSMGVRKGYYCPVNSYCVSTDNPYNGTVSFDNIFQSLELVFVVMTSNTYTDLMYYLADSDYLFACFYFAAGIVIMTLWLLNLLIAVITSSFQVMREESRRSAFADQPTESDEPIEEPIARKGELYQYYKKTSWVWIVVILYSIVCQCFRSAGMGHNRELFINLSETVVTYILLAEIVLRFAVDWRDFFRHKSNWVDLALAIITSVIQIPQIHESGQPYAWLTFFQIVRVYRVVLAIRWTKDLILLVLGNLSGLLNLILFVFLLTFLASIFASELFRGSIPKEDQYQNVIHVTFATIYNSFLGMYQVFSSENWTILLYNVTTYNNNANTAWMGAVFFVLWFTLAFFVVLNMFIAVIQENFDVSEDEKRIEQVKAFLQRKELGRSSHGTLSLSTLFKPRRLGLRRQDPLDYGPAMMDQLLKEAVVQDFVGDSIEAPHTSNGDANGGITNHLAKENQTSSVEMRTGPFSVLRTHLDKSLNKFVKWQEINPFYSKFNFSRTYGAVNPRTMAREVVNATEQRKKAQREYLRRYPNYNVSLFLFRPGNPLRRFCQKLVGPGRGTERIEGTAPSTPLWYGFSAFLYVTIVGMVLLACITTPVYQKQYFATREYTAKNWFVFTDLGFAAVFTIEAVVRVVADGFIFTPHAYFRSSWGLIDGVVLVTLWINVLTALFNQGAVSRAVGAFKALRALRLLNISDSARDTFHAVIVRGGWKVVSAAFVSLSLLIPFAIYGLNLFNGRMEFCNDNSSGIFNLTDCVNEYSSSPYAWNVLAPRQVTNPYYNFDDFANSLFILFQIVSQEGWTDVMWSAESITGFHTQPKYYAGQGNAVFFVIFNLLGAVFVLTLFISVFMRNYTEQTGVAFLTAEQRSWMELRNRLRQISPSKRPVFDSKRDLWSKPFYDLVVRKTGIWQRFVTAVLLFHLLLLCLEFYPVEQAWDEVRTYIFLVLTLFYLLNIIIRIIGLTWTRFRKNAWDVYSLITVTGTLVVTLLLLLEPVTYRGTAMHTVWTQLHKIFLVSIVLLLIPRNNQLDQLFKTAAASLSAIANLLATWLVLFLVFAIAMTQTFGLTRFGPNETGNVNFRNVPKALILLFRMSTGEGWNQIMTDYAAIYPPYCTEGETFLDSDCGSANWARALFIAWNILSMYIFVNMFISLIFESFSYVYQRSSGLAVVTRKELRRFKQAWAECDPNGTGYIQKESLPRLLSELSGVFDMRVYPEEFGIGALMQDCKVNNKASNLPIIDDSNQAIEIDLAKLNERLSRMPVETIRKRRRELNVFNQEVIHSARNSDQGIGFTQLLMILAHYRIIKDNKSLRLEEFLRRRARLQMVEDDVRRAIVSTFLDTLYWKRYLRRAIEKKRSARMTTIPQLSVPEIFIEDEDEHAIPEIVIEDEDNLRQGRRSASRPALSISIPSLDSSAATHVSGRSAGDMSPGSALRNRADSNNFPSPTVGSQTIRTISPQQSPQLHGRISDVSASSRLGVGNWGDGGWESGPPSPFETEGGHSRRLSDRDDRLRSDRAGDRSRAASSVSAQGVLEVLDQSAWGQSLRRSITRRRGGSGGY